MASSEGALFAVGICLGVVVMDVVSLVVLNPISHDEQFRKDCGSMVHGTVVGSAHDLCVRDGKILFHE